MLRNGTITYKEWVTMLDKTVNITTDSNACMLYVTEYFTLLHNKTRILSSAH